MEIESLTVREQLREEEPILHDALERSWRIAEETWLPAITPSLGSHNAYPHLHNMELRLDDIVQKFGSQDGNQSLSLSPVEKYLLLAAILFHDVGRASKPDQHEEESKRLIKEYWAEYGIPTAELARIIAELALRHDTKKRDPLTECSIDPYGRVREGGICAILILLDHLDMSHLRVIPKDVGEGPKAFRTLIKGLEIDPETRLIRSVLGDFGKRHMPAYATKRKLERCYFGKKFGKLCPRAYLRKKLIQNIADGKGNLRRESFVSLESGGLPDDLAGRLSKIKKPYDGRTDDVKKLAAILRDLLAKIEGGALEEFEQLALVQRDLRDHREKLTLIRTDLWGMGITLDDWLLEFQEHLFDGQGFETWEPIFDVAYLCRMVEQMWNLSIRVFGTSWFSYDVLAAAMRDPDVGRVKRAVRRLRIITDCMEQGQCPGAIIAAATTAMEMGAIEANETAWRWKVSERDGTEPRCYCVKFDKVTEELREMDKQKDK